AEIVPDASLPVNTTVFVNDSNNFIQGGTQAGNNLFHSFREFSLLAGETAFFNNSTDIQNIFSRVTGGSISNIDGTIKANGTANLFLLNPNGIIFGPKASLNIGGSFVASTANALQFGNGREFGVNVAGQNTPLLIVSVPLGLQYGQQPGSIVNRSTAGLQVRSGNSLILAGGDVRADGGKIIAPGGRVELAAVAGGETVGLNASGNNVSLNVPAQVARTDISLTNGAEVNARAGGGGNIAVNAHNFSMSRGSTLRAGIDAGLGAPDALAGNIDVNAAGAIALDGDGTFISNALLENATGTGGDVNLTANSLTATNGVQIYAGTRGQGDAGSVNINVSNAASFDGARTFSSGAYSRVESQGTGQGGNVNLIAGSLNVTNGAVLQASTLGRGNVGSVNVNVRETAIFDGTTVDGDVVFSSGIYNRVETAKSAVGEGGSINIVAGSLFVTDGAVITASTGAQGNAGNVTVTVRDRIILDGTGPLSPALGFGQSSGLFSSVKETAVGEGGNIRIATRSLSATNGAVVIANTFGEGNGGRIQINADTVNLAGVEDGQSSGIFTPTESTATGNAGEITVNTNSLRVGDGAVISSRTLNARDGGNIAINARTFEAINGGQVLTTATGGGRAGNINLNVSENTMLAGVDRTFADRVFDAGTNFLPSTTGAASGIYANTSANSTGAGGNLNVRTGQLIIRDGAQVTVSADGRGAAGNLRIAANSIRLDSGAIKATTQAGNFGNITLQTRDLQLRRHSQITTNASGTATGGNINIEAGTVAALENSDIRANAIRGRGGNIVINTQGIFRSFDSDIDASSELGIDGRVELRTPDIDPVKGLNQPETPGVPPQPARGCQTSGQRASRFVITGRGGLPPTPSERVTGGNEDNFDAAQELVEAQGWIINAKGEVELVANSPVVVPYSPGGAPICN
ncbi:filamentous hemagglutinin N-terminal domain-containing protein, partial [Microcoleus sp. herbarium7]|uniref:two-partner secretion domain-containing protein n=1 Tax=Microcoleus sp. herbarium7 TaxID=3055435 RepID=UPI002FCEEBC6